MYLDTWDDFQKAAEDIYIASPLRVTISLTLLIMLSHLELIYVISHRQDTSHRTAISMES